MKSNVTLQALYLENNKLGDQGALAIAIALEQNEQNAVHSCHMNKNGLTKVGHQAVRERKATKVLEEEARFQAVLDNLENINESHHSITLFYIIFFSISVEFSVSTTFFPFQ